MTENNKSLEAKKHHSVITGATAYVMHSFYREKLSSINEDNIDDAISGRESLKALEAQLESLDDKAKDLINSYNTDQDALDSFVSSAEWLSLNGFADGKEMLQSFLFLAHLAPYTNLMPLIHWVDKLGLSSEEFSTLINEAKEKSNSYEQQAQNHTINPGSPDLAGSFYPKIDSALCTGCESCIRICPENAIVIKNNKVCITKDCVECWICVEECSFGAILIAGLPG